MSISTTAFIFIQHTTLYLYKNVPSFFSLFSDPDEWFLENEYSAITRTSNEGTVPCLVTDPKINVTLHDKDTGSPVMGKYIPTSGFTGILEDKIYKCRGERNGEEKWSNVFYVFSILGRCLCQEKIYDNCLHVQCS